MGSPTGGLARFKPCQLIALMMVCCLLGTGCQELETIKNEVVKKFLSKIGKRKRPFVERDGITMRATPLYRTANLNSEVMIKLPAETPVHLIDKVGEWFRVRTREGREGYVLQKVVGGEEIIEQTQALRRSIEGMPVQAEGVLSKKANFRLEAGRENQVVEVLPPGKRFEMYERVVTLRRVARKSPPGGPTRSRDMGDMNEAYPGSIDPYSEQVKKDVWYKVKIEDGRVGFIYTHNLKFTPPDDIARLVPFLRLLAWRTINTTDDPDLGVKNNYVVAFAPIGKDPGCDYTWLYFMTWSKRNKRRVWPWRLRINGILPITNYQLKGKPGFSVRYLHPSRPDKLVLANYVLVGSKVRKVSEEEIPNPSELH